VLAAQNEQLQQEESLAAIEAKRLDAWALLMKELGGGFAAAPGERVSQGAGDAGRN
jgi:outer membrane protein TolC